MKRQFILLLIFLILIFSCSNISKHEEKHAELLKEYKNSPVKENAVKLGEFYFTKYADSFDHIETGMKFFEESRKAFPDSPELAVLHGNLYTKYGGLYAKKMDFTKAVEYCGLGFEIMDETVMKNPENQYVLIYRAGNSVTVPAMLNRLGIAFEDLEKLYEMKNKSQTIDMLTLYYYYTALKKDKQKEMAKKIKKELKEKYPDYKKRIKGWLK